MRWSDGFIAVDWGTTNRRAYAIGPGGARLGEMEDDLGILSVPKDGFEDSVAAIREKLGDLPMLLAGMIGSNRGWIEAPYLPCPAGADELARAIKWVEPGRTGIVPGVSWTEDPWADVMRGEEVQIFGALGAKMVGPLASICHPGTHNKWVRLDGGRIDGFRTVMTGEIYSLLREHSILAGQLAPPARLGHAFNAGVQHGFAEHDLTAELFSVRARALLGKEEGVDAPSYVSGLLIGADLAVGLRFAWHGEIVVMGRPELTGLYAAALGLARRECRIVDGEEAFIAGAIHLAEKLS